MLVGYLQIIDTPRYTLYTLEFTWKFWADFQDMKITKYFVINF